MLGIGISEINWKYYKHVQSGQMSRLQSNSFEKQAILYGADKMHKNSIMGTRCLYNWNIEVTLDTPTNSVNNETIDNDEEIEDE